MLDLSPLFFKGLRKTHTQRSLIIGHVVKLTVDEGAVAVEGEGFEGC